jgi:hypothetical protein
MRIATLALLLTGCGLDLESSNDDPKLQRPAAEIAMRWHVTNPHARAMRMTVVSASGAHDAELPPGMSLVTTVCLDGEPMTPSFGYADGPMVAGAPVACRPAGQSLTVR